jgi:hypothetical protein
MNESKKLEKILESVTLPKDVNEVAGPNSLSIKEFVLFNGKRFKLARLQYEDLPHTETFAYMTTDKSVLLKSLWAPKGLGEFVPNQMVRFEQEVKEFKVTFLGWA